MPDPQRVIITRPGMTAHWGVDPSTKRIAVAGQIGSYPQVATHSFPETDGLARLGDIYDGTCEFVRDLLVSWDAPGFVMMEQPSGTNVDPILWYAVGTIITAMQNTLAEEVGSPRMETIAPASWKKVAVGRGNLYKPTRKKLGRTPVFLDYGVAQWAEQNGYRGSSWDEADALGIAEAARRLVRLEAR